MVTPVEGTAKAKDKSSTFQRDSNNLFLLLIENKFMQILNQYPSMSVKEF